MRLNSVVFGYCVSFAVLIAAASANGEPPHPDDDRRAEHENLAWRDFSHEELVKSTEKGRTVLIWIRADWDLESLIVEKKVLAADEVVEAIEENAVVTLHVDITDPKAQRPKWPNWLDVRSCPRLYAVGPGRQRIVILDGAIEAGDVTAALGFVGESKNDISRDVPSDDSSEAVPRP